MIKELLLQAIYSVRSETQLVERIDTDLLFRWFLDMNPAIKHNHPRLQKRTAMWRRRAGGNDAP